MADEKKKDDKKNDKPKGWNLNAFEFFILLLFILAFLSRIVPAVIDYVSAGELTFYGFRLSRVYNFFLNNSLVFKALGLFAGFGGAVATFVLNKKTDAVIAAEKAKLYPADMPAETPDSAPTAINPTLARWQEIVLKSESLEPSNWRVAIIEADIMLDELLQNLRLPGETIGDRLKAVEPSDFVTLDYAWEAHKARNMIAHEGSNFLLSQRETRRVISLYGAVFKEFGMI